ncbi:MAG: class I SAM-dependent methyltransferase [Sphingobacteriales bacterium]|jgi:trans-aconitate methyltransferase|nr:MAG: class I SAM-dependent methyltransferase [Sphingobacteriales bacterium]
MNNQLTEPVFWKNFWEAKQNLVFKIKPDYTFHQLIGPLIKQQSIKSAIELGGFPGYYSVFLRKYFDIDVTLFDYYIHPQIIENLLFFNDLAPSDIAIIEADLFTYQPQKTYDMVCSFGLIEHFNNTENIIAKHLNYLSPGGTLLITLPNFKGINGWIQKTFDRYNYDKHFISCMDLDILSTTAQKLGLHHVQTFYNGGFSTWIENKEHKPIFIRVVVKFIWLVGKIVSKIIRSESKLMSPYIVLIAQK